MAFRFQATKGAPVIKRTVEISQEPAHLSVELDQLLIRRRGESEVSGRIPCEDIGLLLVDQPETTYSHGALAALVDFGAGLVICGRNHLPAGVLLPIADHSQVVWRVEEQLSVSAPLRKQLWKQIVTAKVRRQAANLPVGPARTRLLELARHVRSGDPANVEAQAAKVYWSAWAACLTAPPPGDGRPDQIAFRRNPDASDPLNSMLNYGYAVLRAAIARALVGAGLIPALGIHHANRSNAFCLADDLLEPLRPLVDARVRTLHREGRDRLDRPTKAGLLDLLTVTVRAGDQTGPLMVSLHRMVASLVHCYQRAETHLTIPVPVKEVDEPDGPF